MLLTLSLVPLPLHSCNDSGNRIGKGNTAQISHATDNEMTSETFTNYSHQWRQKLRRRKRRERGNFERDKKRI